LRKKVLNFSGVGTELLLIKDIFLKKKKKGGRTTTTEERGSCETTHFSENFLYLLIGIFWEKTGTVLIFSGVGADLLFIKKSTKLKKKKKVVAQPPFSSAKGGSMATLSLPFFFLKKKKLHMSAPLLFVFFQKHIQYLFLRKIQNTFQKVYQTILLKEPH
jgi:hypothetical protein